LDGIAPSWYLGLLTVGDGIEGHTKAKLQIDKT